MVLLNPFRDKTYSARHEADIAGDSPKINCSGAAQHQRERERERERERRWREIYLATSLLCHATDRRNQEMEDIITEGVRRKDRITILTNTE